PGHTAELNIFVTDRRTVGFDTICRGKTDRDCRPALDQRAIAEPSGNNRRDDRNGPHPREACPLTHFGSGRALGDRAGGGGIAQRGTLAAYHITSGSKKSS